MTSQELILKELKNSFSQPMGWRPGMSLPMVHNMKLANASNGNIDSSAAGYRYTMYTTTLIRAAVVAQKFYRIPFAEYVPVIPGEAAWLEEIKTNLVYSIGGTFEQGIVNLGNQQTRLARVETAVSPVTQTIATWAKKYDFSIIEVNKALAADNWNVQEGKMKALKTEWDLGLQKMCFLGILQNQTQFPGLLSNAAVNINNSVIEANISTLSYAAFNTLVATILDAYWENSNHTAMPDHFGIPQSDWLGLGAFINPQYPLADSTYLAVLLKVFREVSGNPNFVIYPVLYGDMATNAGYWTSNGTQRYVLYRKDPESVRMDLPLDFVLTAPIPVGAVEFEGAGYGQFTSPVILRPAEMLYFDHT
jgi:hypothetical protein